MRRLLPAAVVAGILALLAGAWWYYQGTPVGTQLASFRIGQAESFEQAKREIATVERQPNRDEALRELMSGWRTGNESFDRYLATYVSEPESSEALRRAFSLELSWRPELLADWAHFWSWRTKQSLSDEIASLADYLDTLSTAKTPHQLTWREVLNVQAMFSITGQPDLARRLDSDNWSERYRAWRQAKPDYLHLERPSKPLPEKVVGR